MIKNIVFDIGNVLTDFRYRGFLKDKGLDDAMIERVEKCTVNTSYWHEFDISTNKGGTFDIDIGEMEEMLDAYPLKLAANIVIEDGTMISIPREKKIDVNLEIGMETDGKIELSK